MRIKAEGDALLAALAEAKRTGVEPGSPQADELAARHRASIERFYDCGDEMHRNLVEMYLADERFTRYYDDVEPGLAQFVHDIVVESLRYASLVTRTVRLRPMAGQPPSGTVTFLLTDLEGSTRMWEQDPVAMKAAMVRHDEILEKTIAAHRRLRVRADGRRHGGRIRDGEAMPSLRRRRYNKRSRRSLGEPHTHCGRGSGCTPTRR